VPDTQYHTIFAVFRLLHRVFVNHYGGDRKDASSNILIENPKSAVLNPNVFNYDIPLF